MLQILFNALDCPMGDPRDNLTDAFQGWLKGSGYSWEAGHGHASAGLWSQGFFSWPYPRRVFQCIGLEITFWYGVPYEMVLRNIYSLVILALVASSCSSYWLSTILSGRVLQRGWPGSDSSRWSSPCSCELNSASRVSSQFIFTPRNHM